MQYSLNASKKGRLPAALQAKSRSGLGTIERCGGLGYILQTKWKTGWRMKWYDIFIIRGSGFGTATVTRASEFEEKG